MTTTFIPMDPQPRCPCEGDYCTDPTCDWPDAPHQPGDVVKVPEAAFYRDGDERVVYQDGALKTRHGQRYLSGRKYGQMKQPEVDELLKWGWALKSPEEMPAWAMRERVIQSIRPELRDGVWGWVCELEAKTGE